MTKQPEPRRFYVRSPDGRAIFGFDERAGAETAALAYGDGAFLVDTQAQAYLPMLQECLDREVVYSGYGGWDTGRFGVDRDFIEAIKKGHVAIVHAFLAKGADVNARDGKDGPALHWAAGGGKPEIVTLLLDHGADVTARDAQEQSALDVAEEKGRVEAADILRQAGAGDSGLLIGRPRADEIPLPPERITDLGGSDHGTRGSRGCARAGATDIHGFALLVGRSDPVPGAP